RSFTSSFSPRMMNSDEYDFRPAELARLGAMPLVPMVIFALVMHAGTFAHLWPAPHPEFDVDQTILIHQAEASRGPCDADILFVGDSSCLMNFSARRLEELLPGHRVLNLGTLSY